jgi:hypothetical protein
VKKASIYILLFFYVVVQLRPLTAVVQDLIAHTFFKMQHMATVHYENGKYHLHNELKTITEEDSNSTSEKAPSSQKTNETSNQINHRILFVFETYSISLPQTLPPDQNVITGFDSINAPPPKMI